MQISLPAFNRKGDSVKGTTGPTIQNSLCYSMFALTSTSTAPPFEFDAAKHMVKETVITRNWE